MISSEPYTHKLNSNTIVCLCVCRCEDMVDVRRLKMLQMVQLFKCEEDASQVRHTHTHFKCSLCVCLQVVYFVCMYMSCVCCAAGGGVAWRAPGRPPEDSRQTRGRFSGDQDHVGQTQEVCGCCSGQALPAFDTIRAFLISYKPVNINTTVKNVKSLSPVCLLVALPYLSLSPEHV